MRGLLEGSWEEGWVNLFGDLFVMVFNGNRDQLPSVRDRPRYLSLGTRYGFSVLYRETLRDMIL